MSVDLTKPDDGELRRLPPIVVGGGGRCKGWGILTSVMWWMVRDSPAGSCVILKPSSLS
jgi:hypothetical protein